MDIPAALAAEPRCSLAPQPLHGPMLGAARDAQALSAAQRGHLHDRATDRLRDRQGDLDLEVFARALEHQRGLYARDHVQIAWLGAADPGLALAGKPDAASVTDAGGDVDAHALDRALRPGATTRGAGILDDRARSVTARTGLGDRKDPLALALHPTAIANGTDLWCRSGLGAGAIAGGAWLRGRHRQRKLGALHRLIERQRDLGLEIAAALRGPGTRAFASARAACGPAAAEQIREDVAEAAGERSRI